MILRKWALCGMTLAGVLVAGGALMIQQANGQVPAYAAPAADIDIGTPTSDMPMLITPLLEGGVIKDGHHGEELTTQDVFFDPTTHEISLAKKPPRGQRTYGNRRIDAAYYDSDLSIFNYLTTDREPIGNIILTCAHKKLIISPNYVISIAKDQPMAIDPATYCAFVQFVKGDECNKPGTTVAMHRNAEKPTPAADGLISKINRKTDVIIWTVEHAGAVIKTGSFGFPLVATEPDLVKYVIRLP